MEMLKQAIAQRHKLLRDVLGLHEALLGNALLLNLFEFLHRRLLALTLAFHLLLYHCTLRIAHFVNFFGQAEVWFVSKMRQKGRLLHCDQLFHLGLLLDLLKVDRVVTLETLLILPLLPQRRQIVDFLFDRLRHSIEHLLCLASRATIDGCLLLVLLSLFFLHVLSTTTQSFLSLLVIYLIVVQGETWKEHHVSLVI